MKNISLAKIGAFGLCRRFLYWSCLSFQVSNLCYRREKPQKWHSFQNSPVCGQFGLVLSLLFYALFSLSAVAQEHEGEGDVEKIDVIGSHIKRTNVEGPSPVLVITREEIEMSGHNSLADVLRDLPVASFGTSPEMSMSSPTSGTSTSLRGQGDDMLFLLNGRRLNPYGGGDKLFDLTVIPLAAIERVELLLDGASAIYGSDAISVINIKTKKNQPGGQVNVQGTLVQRKDGNSWEGLASFFDFWNWNETGLPEGETSWRGKGDKLKIDASYGGSKNDINYLVGGQVRFDAPLYYTDRDFGRFLSPSRGSPQGSPGSWREKGSKTWNPAVDCPDANKNKAGQCAFDWSEYVQFSPQILQTSAFAKMDTPLNDSLDFTGQALYSWTRSFSSIAPPPDSFAVPKAEGDTDYTIPAEVAKTWGLSANNPVEVYYRLVDEEGAGPRLGFLNVHSYQTHLSLNQSLGDTLELAGHLSASGSYYSFLGKGYANKEKLFNMAKEGKFNPFKLSGEKDDVSSALYEPTNTTFDSLISFEPVLTGELTEIANQPLMFAVGALGAHQYYMQENDAISNAGKQWGGQVTTDGEGDRFYGALYGELGANLFEVAELQLAVRSDYYSDFGLSWQDKYLPMPFSPRVALSVQPVDELKFRASWGLGFKAPALSNLYKDKIVSYPWGPDYVVCKKDPKSEDCNWKQHHTVTSANQNLQPETFESFNIGMVFEPIESFSISLDYYRTDRENIMEAPPIPDIMEHEAEYGVKFINDLGQKTRRGSDGKVISVERKYQNVAKYKVRGLDLTADLTIPLNSGWDIGVTVQHSHLLYVENQTFEGGLIQNPVLYYDWMVDSLGWLGVENTASKEIVNKKPCCSAPRWRNRAILSFMNKDMGHKFDLIVHNTPSTFVTKDVQTLKKEQLDETNKLRKEDKKTRIYFRRITALGIIGN